ncbi:MAG: LysR family transcriptional regulator [Oligoflexia bacterium]|nr:LysR family transcriptional regulator [Oligoflexia bacterium]
MERLSLEDLSWELSVLSRAVVYRNLSGAAQNIGLSQPQLSRILHRLEAEFESILLDRSSRRKAAWTPLAHQIAEAYLKSVRSLNGQVLKLLEGTEPKLIHIGTLEGLVPVALRFGHHILTETTVQMLDLDVFDLNVLEEKFFQGDLDVIFTAREPGRKKYGYTRLLGYQTLQWHAFKNESEFSVMSSYEYAVKSNRAAKTETSQPRTLISNSLLVRRHWLEEYGGSGTTPSELHVRKQSPKSGDHEEEVYLFGQDSLSVGFWKKLNELKF